MSDFVEASRAQPFSSTSPTSDAHALPPAVLQRVVDSSRYGFVCADPNQRGRPIVFANPAFAELTGYSVPEVLGRSFHFLTESPCAKLDENGDALASIDDAIARGRHAVVVLRSYRRDGSAFWSELSVFPVPDREGKPLLIVGQHLEVTERVRLQHDIEVVQREQAARIAERTAELRVANERLYYEILERRKAELALRVAERKFRSIFEHAVIGIYQSNPDGRYREVNPALARLYGFDTPADMLKQVGNIAHDIYVDPGMRARFRELIERDGIVRNLEYQVRSRNGSIIWISENARVVRDRRGRVLYYEGMIQDITARKEAEAETARLEEQLLQAQKMEAIGTLAGGIAHDFNNIIGAIVGHAEMALDDVPAANPATQNLRNILTATHRAKDLVNQILAFSRRNAPQQVPMQLADIVDESVRLLRATLPAWVQLDARIDDGDTGIVGDPGQLQQVLLNLATNAIHAMQAGGGTLTIGLESAPPVQERPAGWTNRACLRLSVADTGCGMPPEVLERIFEPFYTTKPVGVGTGLGLSVAHGIIANHGGRIRVQSAVGQGTTFAVWLPRAVVTGMPGGPREADSPAHGQDSSHR